MKHATILSVTDGATADWSDIPSLDIDCLTMKVSTDVTASAQICRDDTALYLHLSANEAEICAEENGPLGMPCRDSCLEFFFCPRKGDSRYFNFEWNPRGCLFLGFGSGIQDQTRLLPGEAESLFSPVIRTRTDGWEIFFWIPFAFILRFFPDFVPAAGTSIRANFYKCAEQVFQPHYLSWNPVTGTEGAVFHAPDDFGMLDFV